jgi:DegV family protein with EDD domain
VTIKVVTDSTCDLPPEIIEAYDITVVPLYINVGTQGYLDGVEISRKEFYTRLPDYPTPPTTATPGPERFRQVYEKLAEEGATEILSIHISISLSGTLNGAQLGARETESVPVTVFDSRQLSLGTGFLVLTAARAAAEGRSMEEILALLEEQISRTYVFAALDTLEFLKRSGRMNWAVAGLGTLLRIKPLLHMYDGNPTSIKVRTREAALRRVIQLLKDLVPLERVALVHTHAPKEAERLRQRVEALLPPGDLWSMDITPVIGAHIGPGAVGFACITAQRKSG